MTCLEKLRPAVDTKWLYLLAGLTWSGVGVMLIALALGWLQVTDAWSAILLGGVGLLLAYVIYRFGFVRFARRNDRRIGSYKEKRICVFAFQEWTSYPLVLVMVSLGIALRKYAPIPKPYLAVLYIGIGGGLFLASLVYHRKFLALTPH